MAKKQYPSLDVLLASGQVDPMDLAQYQSYDNAYNATVNPEKTNTDTTLHNLGFMTNAQGQFAGLDPTNAFGQYQGNLRSLADQLASNRAASISRGLRTKGLGAAKERYIRMATDAQNTGLLNQGMGALANFQNTVAGATATRDTGKKNYGNSLLQRYLQDVPDNVTGPGQDGGPGPSPDTTPNAAVTPFTAPNVLGKGNVLDTPQAPFTPTSSPGTPSLINGPQVDPGISLANIGGVIPDYINPYAGNLNSTKKKGAVL